MISNWDDNRYFLAIARQRSLTGAARVLGVSQPTMSRRLEALELIMEVRLFDRTRSGYELTPSGAKLFEVAQRIEEELDNANRTIFAKDLDNVGLLSVTCTEILFNSYLSRFVWQFLAKHRAIEFRLSCTQSLLSISRRDADLAVRFTQEPPETLAGRRLASVAYAIYTTTISSGDRFQADNREQWDWIGYSNEADNRAIFGELMPERGFKHRLDSMAAIHSMVRDGLGVTLLPCYIADRDPGFRRLDPERIHDPRRDLWILYHPDMRRVHKIRLFADFVADVVSADLDLFEGRRPLALVTSD
jgi:DNA-binding transcriptional LysR family regulator